jgi:phage tail-like protein
VPGRRDNPYANFNFLVEIDGIASAGFSEVAIGASSIDVIEYREGGDRTSGTRKLPGRVHHGNVVLRRGIAGDTSLYAWFAAIRDGAVDARDVAIVLLDESRQPVARWLLRRAWPAKWQGPALNAKGNETAIETLELATEGIELEAL